MKRKPLDAFTERRTRLCFSLAQYLYWQGKPISATKTESKCIRSKIMTTQASWYSLKVQYLFRQRETFETILSSFRLPFSPYISLSSVTVLYFQQLIFFQVTILQQVSSTKISHAFFCSPCELHAHCIVPSVTKKLTIRQTVQNRIAITLH